VAARLPRTNEILNPEGSTAALWAARWFGGPTTLRQTTAVMGLTAARILPNNPRRVFWQIINRSVNNVSIGFDNAVTIANGIALAPSAGFATMAVQEDGEPVSYEVIGIADVAASNCNVLEIIRV
jgi:hypothetical protein